MEGVGLDEDIECCTPEYGLYICFLLCDRRVSSTSPSPRKDHLAVRMLGYSSTHQAMLGQSMMAAK